MCHSSARRAFGSFVTPRRMFSRRMGVSGSLYVPMKMSGRISHCSSDTAQRST